MPLEIAGAARGRALPLLLLIGAAGLVAIGLLLSRSYVSVRIKDILDRPDRFENKVVTVVGYVEDSISLFGIGSMSINDGTGSIWVAKRGPAPPRGTRVRVRGRVNTMLQIGELTVVGIQAE
ncbi:MAG: hypothetical protein N2512_09865 [Armatimonadetes bacterium]|nr:hypothetical protein [Armatimonadota bacterium]